MLLLALDTTTLVCSVALGEEKKLWAEYSLNIQKTHSQRLMPLIINLFEDAGVDKKEIDGIAVTRGPGSFTGIRIGMATALGLSQGLGIPIVGVMTLDALAWAGVSFPGLICPVLDARKDQAYFALYRGGRETPVEVEAADVNGLDELCTMLSQYREPVLFLGDGVEKFRSSLKDVVGSGYQEAPFSCRLNRSALVLQEGFRIWQEKGPAPAYALGPYYIRASEAERRFQEKKK